MKINTTIKKLFLLTLLSTTYFVSFSQFIIDKEQIISPIKIPLSISGSFAELRDNHYHSGVDFRVQQKEGLPLYAVDDGVVSRIKVSPVGYGNAVYISHKNGITSVYGHLRNYNATIANYVRIQQYKLENFEVDLFPSIFADKLSVKKGDIIGYAGNSGSSGGPHLHFEIRNTITERPINPFLFGISVNDIYFPTIQNIILYQESTNDDGLNIRKKTNYKAIKVSNSKYKISSDTLLLSGEYSFGIKAIDQMTSTGDRNGWYKLQVLVDDTKLLEMVMDSFSFDESRFINACIDYEEHYKGHGRYIVTKKLPGNNFSAFKTINNGIFNFKPNEIYKVKFLVDDINNHTSTLEFFVKGKEIENIITVPELAENSDNFFKFDTDNTLNTKDISIFIPNNSLYNNEIIEISSEKANNTVLSDIFTIHKPSVPLHKNMKVTISQHKVPNNLKSKAIAIYYDKKGNKKYAGGSFKNDNFEFTSRNFGKYAIAVDTVNPVITLLSANPANKKLTFNVKDNLSGISKYNGFLNNKWVVVSWDPKSNSMKYDFDDKVLAGKNTFKLVVEDAVGNTATSTVSFNY